MQCTYGILNFRKSLERFDMKQIQIVIIILVAITIFFSSISLAKLSERKEINFMWYSELANDFVSDKRDTSGDEWFAPDEDKLVEATFINDKKTYMNVVDSDFMKKFQPDRIDFNRFTLLYLRMKVPIQIGYRIKVKEIVQISDKVYIKLSLNSAKDSTPENTSGGFIESDLIRITKSDVGEFANLKFVFKDQYGIKIEVTK